MEATAHLPKAVPGGTVEEGALARRDEPALRRREERWAFSRWALNLYW